MPRRLKSHSPQPTKAHDMRRYSGYPVIHTRRSESRTISPSTTPLSREGEGLGVRGRSSGDQRRWFRVRHRRFDIQRDSRTFAI